MRDGVKIGIAVRSAIFHLVIAIWFAASFLMTPVILLGPRSFVRGCFEATIRGYLWLLNRICGLSYECRGFHRIPPGAVLFASKHLSKWDAAVLPVLLNDPAVVTRRELLHFPLYGAVIRRMRHLPMPRLQDLAATARLIQDARNFVSEGRSILIFPEGTRTAATLPFAPPAYKHGVVALYRALGIPCVPIAVNAGLFWPRDTLLRFPGKIIVEVLPSIPPGLDGADFLAELTLTIETNSERLVAEGLAANSAVSETCDSCER